MSAQSMRLGRRRSTGIRRTVAKRISEIRRSLRRSATEAILRGAARVIREFPRAAFFRGLLSLEGRSHERQPAEKSMQGIIDEAAVDAPPRIPAVPIVGGGFRKLDGPLTQLLRDESAERQKPYELMVRCEAQHVQAARDLIEGGLDGAIVKEVPWVDRGSFLHAVLALDRIPHLADSPAVFKVGLLQTFITNR
jgi:hypothetical protein